MPLGLDQRRCSMPGMISTGTGDCSYLTKPHRSAQPGHTAVSRHNE